MHFGWEEERSSLGRGFHVWGALWRFLSKWKDSQGGFVNMQTTLVLWQRGRIEILNEEKGQFQNFEKCVGLRKNAKQIIN